MKVKEIIIDGVNVERCDYLYNHIDDDDILLYCEKENDTCVGYDCLFKQLAREKIKNKDFVEENKELISEVFTKNNQLTILSKTIKELKQKNEELGKLTKIQSREINSLIFKMGERIRKQNKAEIKVGKYFQALEYIKKIANDDFAKFPFERNLLITAVNEVLNEN